MGQQTDDAADWASARAEDGVAFARIFDRHRLRVLRHSIALTKDHADAEDVVAVVFFEAWRKRESVRLVEGSLLPWLLVTATYTARNMTRASRRYRRVLDSLPAPDPVADHAEQVGHDAALSALRNLPLRDQQVITACVIEGLSEKEAALLLGVPPGTIKSRLSRARRRLAALIETSSSTDFTVAKEAPHAF